MEGLFPIIVRSLSLKGHEFEVGYKILSANLEYLGNNVSINPRRINANFC